MSDTASSRLQLTHDTRALLRSPHSSHLKRLRGGEFVFPPLPAHTLAGNRWQTLHRRRTPGWSSGGKAAADHLPRPVLQRCKSRASIALSVHRNDVSTLGSTNQSRPGERAQPPPFAPPTIRGATERTSGRRWRIPGVLAWVTPARARHVGALTTQRGKRAVPPGGRPGQLPASVY